MGYMFTVRGNTVASIDGRTAIVVTQGERQLLPAEVPVTLMGKLPLEFKTLGFSTHSLFDALAMNAEDIGGASIMMTGVGTLLQNCTRCHAGYKIRGCPR